VTATFGVPEGRPALYRASSTRRAARWSTSASRAAAGGRRPARPLLEPPEVGRLLAPRPRDAHKGTFGHVLVIAGSRGKTGAALPRQRGGRAGARAYGRSRSPRPAAVARGPRARGDDRALPEPATGAALGAPCVDALLEAAAVVCGPGLGLADATRDARRARVRRAGRRSSSTPTA
jgi:NAD(P)H-hydrate epimerase